ncbi:MAG: DsbC family protein [Candidatus Thiodiazotropha sp. (ex Epidulcina cf. delphinae)]|nr:DsbC family protein [Candidatus Thiodiazotropha sp. (ex Epidulcina cf. delphinae)]
MKYFDKVGLKSTQTLSALLSIFFAAGAMAESAQQNAEMLKVREGIGKIIQQGTVSSITPTEIGGLYEVLIGPQIFYVSADGKYLLSGKLFNIDNREDLTTPKVSQAKARFIEQAGEDGMVIFSPEKYSHTVTVFTDIDCGYCRKLHSEINDYNALGIRVRYLMYPRAGVGSPSYDKAVSVWCEDDQNDAMTRAKAGEDIEKKVCDNPVVDHLQLGKLLGVSGTPTIFLQDGDMLPGYVPAKRMSAILEGKKAGEAKQASTNRIQ